MELDFEVSRRFQRFEESVVKGLVLGIADISKTFDVEKDASDFALEGILLQDDHPIVYKSRKLNAVDSRYAANENEMLAVVHCLRAWR